MSSLELERCRPDVIWVMAAGLMWLASRVTPGVGALGSFSRPLGLILPLQHWQHIVVGACSVDRADPTR